MRYKTLEKSNKNLELGKDELEGKHKKISDDLASYNKRCADEVLIHTNEISKL